MWTQTAQVDEVEAITAANHVDASHGCIMPLWHDIVVAHYGHDWWLCRRAGQQRLSPRRFRLEEFVVTAFEGCLLKAIVDLLLSMKP